jgi:hypothetical protein
MRTMMELKVAHWEGAMSARGKSLKTSIGNIYIETS